MSSWTLDYYKRCLLASTIIVNHELWKIEFDFKYTMRRSDLNIGACLLNLNLYLKRETELYFIVQSSIILWTFLSHHLISKVYSEFNGRLENENIMWNYVSVAFLLLHIMSSNLFTNFNNDLKSWCIWEFLSKTNLWR